MGGDVLGRVGATLYTGDALAILKTLPDESVQCVMTSPPYWGLRSYNTEPQVWGGEFSDDRCPAGHDWQDATYQQRPTMATLNPPILKAQRQTDWRCSDRRQGHGARNT